MKLLEKSHIQIRSGVTDWKEAIAIASQPLLDDHSITSTYVDAMIQTVLDLGSYIVLAPYIALPHARSNGNVHKDGMSLLKLLEPVYFDEDEDSKATIILPLACENNEGHLDMLAQVAEVLGDPTTIERLLKSNDVEEIYQIFSNI